MSSLRTTSRMFSCQVGLTLSLLGIFMVYGTIMPQELIRGQVHMWGGLLPRWGVFTQPLGFVLFMAASMAATMQTPFDLPGADVEPVAGHSTEYSAMRFGKFVISEFVGILLVGAVGAALFLGGWHVPFLPADAWWADVLRAVAFLGKAAILVYLQVLVRWTVPRMRYDQMLDFGWKMLIPLGLVNFVATAVVLFVLT